MAGRARRRRRPGRAAPRRLREGPRRGALHRGRPAARDAPHGAAPQPARTLEGAPHRPRRRRGRPGRPGRDRPGRGRRRRRGGRLRGLRGRRGRRGDARAGRGGRGADRDRLGGARAAARRGGGRPPRLARLRVATPTSAATTSVGSPRPTRSSSPTTGRRRSNHNSMETHQCVCQWRGDGIDVHISTQYIWGIRQRAREGARRSPRTRCGSSASSWAAASARRPASTATSCWRPSSPAARDVPCAAR